MEYFYLIAALVAGVHAYTYGQWLKTQGNRAGAVAVFLLVVLSVALPVYRIITAP